MKKRLLYIHNSIFDVQGANRIQVAHMSKAFHWLDEFDVGILSAGKNQKKIRSMYSFPSSLSLFLIRPIKNYYLRSLQLFFRFRKLHKQVDYVYTRDLFVAYLISKFYRKVKVIYELHEIVDNIFWELLMRRTFPKLSHMVTISQGLKDEMRKSSFYRDNKIRVLPDGVDMNMFDISVTTKKAREQLNLPFDKILVTYIGSLKNWKGFQTFLDSSRKFSKDEKIQYLLIGGNEENINQLKKYHPHIIFVPHVESSLVPLYQKAADVLVLPNSGKFLISRSYTSPLKLFEYMASRKPIIASDLESIREIVDEKDVSFFIPDNANDLARAVEEVCYDLKGQENKLMHAYHKVKLYTWRQRAHSIVQLFRL